MEFTFSSKKTDWDAKHRKNYKNCTIEIHFLNGKSYCQGIFSLWFLDEGDAFCWFLAPFLKVKQQNQFDYQFDKLPVIITWWKTILWCRNCPMAAITIIVIWDIIFVFFLQFDCPLKLTISCLRKTTLSCWQFFEHTMLTLKNPTGTWKTLIATLNGKINFFNQRNIAKTCP